MDFKSLRIIKSLAAVAIAICATHPVLAVLLPAEDSGFYNSVGRHSKLDGSPAFGGATPATFNYSVGTIDEGPPFGPAGSPPDVFRKNFFTFDLSGITPGTITGATLELFMPSGGYAGPPSVTYKLYGSLVVGSPGMATLSSDLKMVYSPFVAGELAKASSLFSKIGDTKTAAIPEFGSVTITPAAAGTMLAISLTPSGITYLNLFAGGDVVFGGELDGLTTAGPPDDPPLFAFGFSSPVIPGVVSWDMSGVGPTPTPVLDLTVVPEPSAGALVIIGASLFRAWRRRKV
jgi:hypothetical protein